MIKSFLHFGAWWVDLHCRIRGKDVEEMSKWEIAVGYLMATVMYLVVLFLLAVGIASVVM